MTTKTSESLTETVLAAMQHASALAIERHRRLGESIAVWRDGQVVIVPPEEIPPLDPEIWAKRHNSTP